MRVISLVPLAIFAFLPLAYAQLPPETIGSETMADPGENWFIAKTRDGAYVWNANEGQMLGLLSLSSQTPAVQPNPARREIYAAESYYSRGVRGDRTDILAIYDFENLAPVAEVEIPQKIAVLGLRGHIGLTGSGRHVAVFNMTPGQSVSIVDVEDRRFVGEISTAGCAILMPVAENDFLMICGDGTLQLVRLNPDGTESGRFRSREFFDLETDPMFDRPVPTADGWLLMSHEGQIVRVSTDGDRIRIGQDWPMLTDEDIEDEWRPGGIQLKSLHQQTGLLFVLMHQGGQYTHHEPGSEIWVFDTLNERRVGRIELETPASHILVTQHDEPKLIVADDENGLHVYDALTMKLDQTIEDPGPDVSVLQDF